MRATLLTSIALAGLSVFPAFAQTKPMVRPGHEPGVGLSYPESPNASNIDPSTTRSDIAPRLPDPTGGRDAGPRALIRRAEQALARRQTGVAQEAMERAQTRLLDRSTEQGMTGNPSQDPMVMNLGQAREALAHRDIEGARRLLGQALAMNPGPQDGPAMEEPMPPEGDRPMRHGRAHRHGIMRAPAPVLPPPPQ